MKTSCIFPGQGAQRVGMCKDLYANHQIVRDVFDAVDDALEMHLSKIIFEGPMEELTLTQNTQPALMTCSIAMLKLFEQKLGQRLDEFCQVCVGHSVGEITALTATNAISLQDSARLLKARGKAMQEAVPQGIGAMFALLGANIEIAEEIAHLAGCEVANDNSPKQQVLSGVAETIDSAIKLAQEKGFKAIKLPVSGPFHSKLMTSAQEKLREVLNNIQISEPLVPIIANISADVLTFANIRQNLESQVISRVRWCDSIRYMIEQGVTRFIEIGPGRIYTNLNKQIDPSVLSECSEDLLLESNNS